MNAPLDLPDLDLFQAIHADAPGWQERTFARYRQSVRGVLMSILGHAGELDDLVNEVFVRFFEHAHQVRSAEGLKFYVLSIARNTARERIRERVRERRVFDASRDTRLEEAHASDSPAAHAALAQLRAILARLRDEERRAYVLREIVGLELPRVAEELGISKSTTQRRIAAANAFVRKSAARTALLADYVR